MGHLPLPYRVDLMKRIGNARIVQKNIVRVLQRKLVLAFQRNLVRKTYYTVPCLK